MSTTQERVDGTVDGQRDAMRAILDRQRHAFAAEGPPSVAVRRNRIDRLLALVLDNADAFVDAMAADFGTRPKTGSLFTEILGMISVIEHTRSHVPQWMRATKLMRAARLFGLKAEVQPRRWVSSESSARGTSRSISSCCLPRQRSRPVTG